MKSQFYTMVIGASEKVDRYSNQAVKLLRAHDYPVKALGLRAGTIVDVPIETGQPTATGIHTISLYINPKIQEAYYDYILALAPTRILFNPGTENPDLMKLAQDAGIQTEAVCTLVMLRTGQYENEVS